MEMAAWKEKMEKGIVKKEIKKDPLKSRFSALPVGLRKQEKEKKIGEARGGSRVCRSDRGFNWASQKIEK